MAWSPLDNRGALSFFFVSLTLLSGEGQTVPLEALPGPLRASKQSLSHTLQLSEKIHWRKLKLGNENSARSFSDRSFFEPPWGHGHPRLRVMDVRTEMLVFPGFRGLDRSFCPRTSARISAWTSAGYPAPKLTLSADFSFLINKPSLREAKPGGFQTGGFPTFLGKVQIVSWTVSGLFLVGALLIG